MMDEDEVYKTAGIFLHKELEGHGVIGIMRMAFTYALCSNLNPDSMYHFYDYRYCYEDFADCLNDFNTWDGAGHPKGNWIKQKGAGVDLFNPNYVDLEK